MRPRIPLLAGMCLATLTLAPLAASAAPASAMTYICAGRYLLWLARPGVAPRALLSTRRLL